MLKMKRKNENYFQYLSTERKLYLSQNYHAVIFNKTI